jgi:hypothetical protein
MATQVGGRFFERRKGRSGGGQWLRGHIQPLSICESQLKLTRDGEAGNWDNIGGRNSGVSEGDIHCDRVGIQTTSPDKKLLQPRVLSLPGDLNCPFVLV